LLLSHTEDNNQVAAVEEKATQNAAPNMGKEAGKCGPIKATTVPMILLMASKIVVEPLSFEPEGKITNVFLPSRSCDSCSNLPERFLFNYKR